MLFNSYEFLLAFLPIVWCGYFFIARCGKQNLAHFWLLAASLFYYSWNRFENLFLILLSIIVNFSIGFFLGNHRIAFRRNLLLGGILLNLGILSYFKYSDFFIENINLLVGTSFPHLYNELPLGISFFTFQQIAYLVDSYHLQTKEYNFLNYGLFVSFFPQLIAGPIVHHKEMMVQFQDPLQTRISTSNVARGLFLFTLGLFKKVVVADQLSIWSTAGFASAADAGLIESWVTSLAYTLQLYFDFSGYCDMAVGLGWMFNIKIPYNFLSPYKAANIQDFWRRWHITLSRFLRDYIYIPLGGNRVCESIKYRNLLVVFIAGGVWHGAGWTFIFWGLLHGLALVIHQIWQKFGLKLSSFNGKIITFLFCNFSWVFFRAESWKQATDLINGMIGLHGIHLPSRLQQYLNFDTPKIKFDGIWHIFRDGNLPIIWLSILMIIIGYFPNVSQIDQNFNYSKKYAFFAAILMIASLSQLERISEFLYFNF